jgi:hypothetical protein
LEGFVGSETDEEAYENIRLLLGKLIFKVLLAGIDRGTIPIAFESANGKRIIHRAYFSYVSNNIAPTSKDYYFFQSSSRNFKAIIRCGLSAASTLADRLWFQERGY